MSAELLQACRGSVKADLMRYEQTLLSFRTSPPEAQAALEAEANRLRALLDAIDAQPASSERVALSDEQILAAIQSCGFALHGRVSMTYESGPYDIDRPTVVATQFVRAVEAAHGIPAPAPRPDAPTRQIKEPASGILPVKESDHD
jgi:hypothetical protein